MSNSEVPIVSSSYITIKVHDKEIEKKKDVITHLFSSYPKEDTYFDLTSDGVIIHLRELDFFSFNWNFLRFFVKAT